MIKLPKVIKVGGFDIEVKPLENLESLAHGINGHFSAIEHVIRIDRTLPKLKLMDTLLHEVLHAIYNVGNISDEDEEERIVSIMASGLTQVLRDNPKLRKFFDDCIK